MDSDTVTTEKAAMRKAAKVRRREAWQRVGSMAGEKLARQGIGFAGISAPAWVSAFLPIGDEIDVMPLMARLAVDGYGLSLPVMLGKGRALEFRAWKPGDALDEVQWGIKEPKATAKVVDPDVVLGPLLAFDDAGYRLGYGGGFYDRSLAELRSNKAVVSIGIAFDEQRVDAVPRDGYDQPLDWILTPSGAQQFSGR